MVEIVGRVVRHAQPLHHSARADVFRHRKRHDFIQPKLLESETDRSLRRFGGKAVAPMLECQPPTDFDAGSEMCLESWHVQAHVSDEIGAARDFDGPQAETTRFAIRANAAGQFVALGRGRAASEKTPSRADRHSAPRTPANRRLAMDAAAIAESSAWASSASSASSPFYCDEDFLTTKDAK